MGGSALGLSIPKADWISGSIQPVLGTYYFSTGYSLGSSLNPATHRAVRGQTRRPSAPGAGGALDRSPPPVLVTAPRVDPGTTGRAAIPGGAAPRGFRGCSRRSR